LIVSIVLILAGLAYLFLGNFGNNLVYFVTPSEVVAFTPDRYGKKVRVGGMVVKDSLSVTPHTLKMTFHLTDGVGEIAVAFEGIPPDLFKEGQGAVVEGHWGADQLFQSRMIMAKHSEDYMPIEMKKAGASLPKKDFFKTLQLD
jgi:cytochrome c-type biogenesis protein CcmE